MVLGIDIGGTAVKIGVVSGQGEIVYMKSIATDQMIRHGFMSSLIKAIQHLMDEKQYAVKGIGVGIPGTLCRQKKSAIDVPAILELNNVNIYDQLKSTFPNLSIKIENDANTAGLGEFVYGGHNKNSFLFITLGTGIGSSAIIDGKLFGGANGNGMEMGHFPSINNKSLEQNIGQQPLLNYAKTQYKLFSENSTFYEVDSAKHLFERAEKDDFIAQSVFTYMGKLLGEAIVSTVRILDVHDVIIGGGLSGAIEYIKPGIMQACNNYLDAYYLSDFTLQKATQDNNAGLLGAASMVHHSNELIIQNN